MLKYKHILNIKGDFNMNFNFNEECELIKDAIRQNPNYVPTTENEEATFDEVFLAEQLYSKDNLNSKLSLQKKIAHLYAIALQLHIYYNLDDDSIKKALKDDIQKNIKHYDF